MRLRELDTLLLDILSQDHPEITAATKLDNGHSRLRVDFASGARITVMVREVTGPGVPAHSAYAIPESAL
ncbi:hypothetical protein [Actinokineospora globicatena]|uniref:hypothetical protein n=1 Tax=Actinokineospora globicatena TaxID=103729 RepID=UPI0020A3D4A7|nr:hypothetical protein [Actinokineospora globicatena]MCP2305046.1 hypothetical protein [Actinokineospora globicatena]GLW80511.1 hypothetical protein Aglo01_49920 [Actinokineospora globicatena]GLW87339.1 hypothetical protein Aglo02_49780 [Actinokineospora globicatena]